MNPNSTSEFLTTYVTTPPEVYFLNHTISNYCSISIDRISISGKFHAEQNFTTLKENHWRQVKELDGRPLMFELDRVNKNGEFEQIATLIRDKFRANNWRIDTSNHIQSLKEKQSISNVVFLFDSPHVTRLDIAIDFINYEHAGMNYKIFKPNTTITIHYNKAGKIETTYYGKRKSNVQYRYYDKRLERSDNKKDLPNNIVSWERLELQLRSKKVASNWYKEAMKMLSYFKRPNLTTIADKDPKSFFMLTGILKHPEKFNDLAKGTKAKYRKMIKDNHGFDTSMTDTAMKILVANAEKIKQEINSFFEQRKTDQAHSKCAQSVKSTTQKNITKKHYTAYDGTNLDYQCKTLKDILNKHTGKEYIIVKSNRDLLEGRLNQGFTLSDFESAIDYLIQQKRPISVKDLLININNYLNKINSN